MTDETFANITSDKNDLPPWVEVRSEKFRGVAKNFYLLPIGVLLAIKKANQRQDGSDILMLLDAAEVCFAPEDFERLGDLTTKDFLNAIQQWVHVSYPDS
jgi:hypothetical protein